MSILLVTTDNYNLKRIRSVKTFENIEWGSVSTLIFHSTSDPDISLIRELTTLNDKVDKVIYINSKFNPLYYCIFTGLDADIYDSEDFLSDDEMLEFLVDSYKETGMTVKPPNGDLEVLAKSIATISTSSVDGLQKMLSNEYWTKTLTTAVANVDNAIVRASQININVVEMLTESTKLIRDLENTNIRTNDEIRKMENIIHEMEKKTRPSTPFIFSSYSVPVGVPNVLYIKLYGNCRYLNSFILAYQHYLKMNRQYNAKVLFIMPKLKLLMQKYRDVATRLAPESLGYVELQSNNVFQTFEPKKSVMDAFFTQSGTQIFIVIDMMFGEKLLSGHMVKEIYAVGSSSDIDRFKLKPSNCIMPISARKESILISHINKYASSNPATKRSLYFDRCADSFKRLDKILNID